MNKPFPLTPQRPFAWYRFVKFGEPPVFAYGEWPPPEPDDTAWLPLYDSPEGRPYDIEKLKRERDEIQERFEDLRDVVYNEANVDREQLRARVHTLSHALHQVRPLLPAIGVQTVDAALRIPDRGKP